MRDLAEDGIEDTAEDAAEDTAGATVSLHLSFEPRLNYTQCTFSGNRFICGLNER